MKKVLSVLLVIVILILMFALSFGLELGGLHIRGFFAKEKANIQRDVFKNNKSYVEGMVKDLAKSKKEFSLAKDDLEKKAIVNYVLDVFANFDEENIENVSLKRFLINIREGNY